MICLLCHSIGPYHVARYRELAKSTREDVLVVELASRHSIYPWSSAGPSSKLDVCRLFDADLGDLSARLLAEAVLEILEKRKPDVVVSVGYADQSMRSAAEWARRSQAVSVMVTDTWAADRRRYLPLEWVKGRWCRTYADALFLPGIRSAEYFHGLGFDETRIWRGVSVVDNDYFAQQSSMARAEEAKIRGDLGLPESYFLCCARLAPEKNIGRLLQSFLRYRQRGGDWHLVIVGAGPQEKQLRAQAGESAGVLVHFAGWQQYEDLPAHYALASCFILPSVSEPWGLVVNEAMACGLPVLVSRQCGCAPELCWRGANGYDFDPRNTEEMSRLMLRVSSGQVDLPRMGRESQRIIEHFSPPNWAMTLLDCVATTRAIHS